MRREKEERKISQFEHPSLTDIIMNIFIFFFITTCMLYTFNPTKIGVTLPKVPQGEEVRMPIEITINNKGDIYLHGNEFSVEQLTEKLKEESPYQPIVVRGDKKLQYGQVDEVLDAIWKADPKRTVNLAILVEE